MSRRINPTVVYGAWPYPAYSTVPICRILLVMCERRLPFPLPQCGNRSGSEWLWWLGLRWGNNEVNINASTYNNSRRTTTRIPQKYQAKQNQNWQHNPEHRKGAKYPNQNTASEVWAAAFRVRGRATHLTHGVYGSGGGQRGWRETSDQRLSRGGGDKGGGETSDQRPQSWRRIKRALERIWQGRKRTCFQLSGPGEPELCFAQH